MPGISTSGMPGGGRDLQWRSRGIRIKEGIERHDFPTAHDDEIDASDLWHLTRRAKTPVQAAGVPERLRGASCREDKCWQARVKRGNREIQCVVPNMIGARVGESGILGEDLPDHCAPTVGIVLGEHIEQNAGKKAVDLLGHGATPWCSHHARGFEPVPRRYSSAARMFGTQHRKEIAR